MPRDPTKFQAIPEDFIVTPPKLEKSIEARAWAILGRPLEKARKYISDPSQAPKGVKVQRGKKGGYYYEAEPVRTSLKTQPDEVKRAVKDMYDKGMDAKAIADELESEHGVKVHPETVNRFLEREGISVRPKRETVSRRDVEAQQKTIEEQAKQIEDMSSKLKALKSDVDFYKEKYTALDKENAAMKQEIANLRAMYEALKKPEGGATEETTPEEEKEPEPSKIEDKLGMSGLSENASKIVKELQLDFSEVKPSGSDNKGGWSPKQESEMIHNVNRFATAAKKQYNEGDFKNAYLNMRNYVMAKNRLMGKPIDEFDLNDSLYEIDKMMRNTAKES